MTEYEDKTYLVLTESAAAALQGLISAGLSGDPNTALAAFQSVTPEQFRADFGGLMTSGGDLPALYDYGDSETGGTTMYFWTVWNGDLIGCSIESASWADSVTLEYRAAAGTGFSACWADDHDGNSSGFSYVHSDAMSGWLYSGTFTGVNWQWTDGVLDQTFQFEGGAAEELLQGAYTEEEWDIRYDEDNVAYRSIIRHYVFEAGQMTNAWSDPITGEPCCMMGESVSPEGGIIETGYASADEESMSLVAYVSTGPYFR